ncbi:MAG: polysaccharide biosynthesis/export family protein [Candidatus Korobacteraceae bacterium]|jgi:polysaccharide biosynthesis/export protein
MYLQRQTLGKRIFIGTAIVLLGLWALAAYGQDNQDNAGQPANDSTTAAKPVLPASSSGDANSGKDMAKTTTLPATDIPASHVANVRPDTYIIGIGDVLGVSVWKEGELSKSVAVRPDGIITMPLIGEIKAVGLTPLQLQAQITTMLEKVMSDPVVAVIVDSANSLTYNMMGQVYKPGYFPLSRPITVLDAIALSGGFRDFAKQKKIYILRTAPDGTQEKIKFNYKQVIKGRNMAQNILVEPHDTIVVP